MHDIGRPIYWSLDAHITAIINMIRADEIQIALTMLDQVPAYYREKRPAELEQIRQTLYKNLYDPMEYVHDDDEANCTREFGEAQWTNGYMHPRAEIISEIVKGYNEQDRVPWIFDLGCSHGNLPLGLIKSNHNFTYYGCSLNYRINQKVREWVGEKWKEKPYLLSHSPTCFTDGKVQPTILYNTEVIEHCMNPMDVVQSAYKVGVDFDVILLSVPLGCLGGGLPDWDTRRLGHVRGWSPQEFLEFADKHWPGRQWKTYLAPSMVIVGTK